MRFINSCKIGVSTLALGSLFAFALRGNCAPLPAGAVSLAEAGQARTVIVLPKSPSDSTQWAAKELQGYLRALSGAEVPIFPEDGVPSNAQDKSWILIGGPDQNRLVKQAVNSGLKGFSDLKNDGFVLKSFHLGKRPVVVAGGDSDTGTMYAVFELAEQLGVTFRLSGDIIPERQSSLSVTPLNLRKEPAIEQRGFLSEAHRASIAILSFEDWSRLFDQMAKMKYNYYEFWWFAYEPYVQYSYRGEPALFGDISTKASGYVNTMYEGFGSRTTDDVVIGKQWFPGERLASPEMQHVETPDQAVAVAQDQLKRMIHYAKSRHIDMWLVDEMASLPPNLARYAARIGPKPFEGVFGTYVDPLDSVNREIQTNRLKAMIDTYPEAAGYLLNFSEEYFPLTSAKDLEFFAQPQQQDMFHELKTLMVPWETRWAPRDDMVNSSLGFFDQFKYLLAKKDEFAPKAQVGLATVGRGYVMPMFDKLLPKDIPFATFDTGQACGYGTPNMPMSYFGGMGQRVRIDSPYLDDDCDILAQQFNVWVYTEKDKIFTEGVKNGLTGVAPWMAQPRGTETNSGFLAEADWNPQLTREEFYKNYSQRLFGAGAEQDMYNAFMTLEKNKAYLDDGETTNYPHTISCCGAQEVVGLAYKYSKQPNPYDGPKGSWWEEFIARAPIDITSFEHSITLLDEALASMHAAEPKVAPQGKHELAYLISRTETLRDDMRAQILEREGFIAFDRAFREKDSVSHEQFVTDIESSLQKFAAGTEQTRAATTDYARIVDYPSDLEALYHLNVGGVLGFGLVHDWMQNIVNFNEGKLYTEHVPFERIFTDSVRKDPEQ